MYTVKFIVMVNVQLNLTESQNIGSSIYRITGYLCENRIFVNLRVKNTLQKKIHIIKGGMSRPRQL